MEFTVLKQDARGFCIRLYYLEVQFDDVGFVGLVFVRKFISLRGSG